MKKAPLIALLLLVPVVALAQAVAQDIATPADPPWLELVIALAIPSLCGFISTQFKSRGTVMRIIDAIAFNWGKAQNDGRAQ